MELTYENLLGMAMRGRTIWLSDLSDRQGRIVQVLTFNEEEVVFLNDKKTYPFVSLAEDKALLSHPAGYTILWNGA